MLNKWWRKLFRPAAHTMRNPSYKRPLPRRKLEVELLEDRLAPAGIQVTSLDDNVIMDGQVTLREAIQAANTDTSVDGSTQGDGADTITFPLLFLTPQTINLALGSLALTTDIAINGPGADWLTVRNTTGRVFEIIGDAATMVTTSLDGMTISGDTVGVGGGGIVVNGDGFMDTSLTLTDAALTGNKAADGGALQSLDATLTIVNTTFAGNVATANGGGVFVSGGTATISNSTFSSNSAADDGGGIFNDGDTTVTNTTFSNNSAAEHGGGIFNSGALNLVNDTLTLNLADSNDSGPGNGGGLFNDPPGVVKIVNSIVAGNFDTPGNAGSGVIHPDVSGTVTSLGTNLIGSTAGSDGFGGMDITGADSLLAALGNFGGGTQTQPLLPGSLGINAGQTGMVGGLTIPTTDQRGIPRNNTDIGAFESQGFTIAVVSGNGQRTLIDTDFDDALVVSVVASAFVEPVAGGRVTFTPMAALNGASATVTTDNPATIAADGTAQASVMANDTGSVTMTPYTVDATANGAPRASFSLTNQALTSLAFHQQPTDTKSGQFINQAIGGVIVHLLDQDNMVVTKATNSVAIVANMAGLASGTTPKNAVAGVATFDDLVIKKADDNYKLTASLPGSPAVPAEDSEEFNITASKLVAFTPEFIRSGDTFVVTIEAQDETDEVATNFLSSVTVALESAKQLEDGGEDISGTVTFGGTKTVSAMNGVATFDTLTLNQWGNYEFRGTSAGLPDALASSIVTAQELIIFTQPPMHVRSDDTFNVVVHALDDAGEVAKNFTSDVTLTIATAFQGMTDIAGLAMLGGTTSVAAMAGVASLSPKLDKWGNYTLRAADSGTPTDLDDVVTQQPPFVVTARALEFFLVPDSVRSGDQTIPPGDLSRFSIQVQAVDKTGERALNFKSDVTLALDTAVQVLNGNLDIKLLTEFGGTKTVTAADGLASFTSLTLSKWGTYTLAAADSGLPTNLENVNSDEILVTARSMVFLPTPGFVRSGLPSADLGDPSRFTVQVEAQDIAGGRALNFSNSVTIIVDSAVQVEDGGKIITGTAVMGGLQILDAVSGLATFTGLTLDRWGNYKLRALSAGKFDGVTPFPIVVTARSAFIEEPIHETQSGPIVLLPGLNVIGSFKGVDFTITVPPNEVREFAFEVTILALDARNELALNFNSFIHLSLLPGFLPGVPTIPADTQLISEDTLNTLTVDSKTVKRKAMAGQVTMDVRVNRVGAFQLKASTPDLLDALELEIDISSVIRRNSSGRRRPG
ncbi:MAG: hypothetical protein L0215_18125 [Gemmataceae bacterium]|nr:hypothetical protein [Gemmataceae bacterium]